MELDAALGALARGASLGAIQHFARLDRVLAAPPSIAPGARARLKARAAILAISESLASHAIYLNSEAA
jgi:DNA-binding SARP family transcriptional activator